MHIACFRAAAISSLLLALALVAGCSESHDGTAIDSSMPGIDSGRPGTDSGGMTGTDSGGMTGTDSGGMTGTDSGGMTGTDSGGMTGTDSGIVIMPGPDSGTTRTDAGPPGVSCGADTCTDPQICCVMFMMGGGMPTYACTDPGGCMGIAASCDGPEDCATGEACCGMRGTGGGGSTACVPDAMCTFGRLCHADADCTGMDTCCSFMGANVCTPFCP